MHRVWVRILPQYTGFRVSNRDASGNEYGQCNGTGDYVGFLSVIDVKGEELRKRSASVYESSFDTFPNPDCLFCWGSYIRLAHRGFPKVGGPVFGANDKLAL